MSLYRPIRLSILSTTFAALVGGIAWADVEATLATPSPRPQTAIIDGRTWRCDGAACRGADTSDVQSQPDGRACARAAAELGAFTAYSVDHAPFTDAGLAECNKRAKPALKAG